MPTKMSRTSFQLRFVEQESHENFNLFANLTKKQQPTLMESLQWIDDLDSSSSSSSPGNRSVECDQASNADEEEAGAAATSNSRKLSDLNNSSGQGIDVLNLPSTAEILAKQKAWISINFRYRMLWHQAKPFLENVSKEDAYKPENLNLWTRYVRVSQHRKVPFVNSVRAFCNRMKCPGIQMRYTLNTFYYKGAESERSKNIGPMHPIALPVFRCPDDIPEFRNMANATINVFVTTDDTFFDVFWKEALSKKA